jgi:hypothetical protein
MRRIILLVAAATAVVGVVAAPANAERPRAACGLGFELITIDDLLPLVSDGSPNSPEVLLAALEGLDKNDDDLLCAKDMPDTPGSPSYVRNTVDNTASTSR